MLKSLYIENYTLIQHLSIDFETGFSVITGETGAGKSIMLGALGLLLGQRADTKAIREGAAKCTIEAVFDLGDHPLQAFFEENGLEYDRECIVRREITAAGKSRGFVNDSPAALPLMKALGDRLIDIHSQHQNLLLNTEDFQLAVLDALADDAGEREAYGQSYAQWKEAVAVLDQMREQAAREKSDEDYLRFQLEQLDNAGLRTGLQEELEQEADILSHAEDIKQGLFEAAKLLDNDDGEGDVLSRLRTCVDRAESTAALLPDAQELAERLRSAYIELQDVAQELARKEESVEYDPERLQEVNDALNALYNLQRKHKAETVDDLMRIRDDYRRQLDFITHSDEQIQVQEALCAKLLSQLREQGAALTKKRTKAAAVLEKELVRRLQPLGMPHVRFQAVLDARKEPGRSGMDNVSFLFSANKSGMPRDIASIASGGEVSRLMLSLKSILAGHSDMPTLIFDEIDTGVSGEVADRMGALMQEIAAEGKQVLAITHLPQIASRGRVHYKVYKADTATETLSHIVRLDDDGRLKEIAMMLSGSEVTPEALENARVLLNRKNNDV